MKNRLKYIALNAVYYPFLFLYEYGRIVSTLLAILVLIIAAVFFQMTTGLPWYVFLIISAVVIVSNSRGG